MALEDFRNKVAIIGMGCIKFGALQNKSYFEQAAEAAAIAMKDANVGPDQIEAAWLGCFEPNMGGSWAGYAGDFVPDALGIKNIPVTRTSNYCATGIDALRNAAYGVASGTYDVVMVVGNEKMRDVGSRESLIRTVITSGHPTLSKGLTAPGMFGSMATVHFAKFGTTKEDLARVAVKNHANGVHHPLAMLRSEITVEKVLKAPIITWPLGLFDCCPTTDGSAVAILTRADLAPKFTKDYVLIEALEMATVHPVRHFDPHNDLTGFHATQQAAARAYKQAGVKDPVKEIDLAEVHDCFTITEILNYEDLGFCKKGEGGKFIREGRSSIEGDMPVNTCGGLKCFGHPIGATGVRMAYIIYEQLLHRAPEKLQLKDPKRGMIHNLGGPGSVCGIGIFHQP